MLFLIFLLAFIHPMGSTTTPQPTPEYVNHAFSNGFIQGYNTVDALAALVLGLRLLPQFANLVLNLNNQFHLLLLRVE